MTRRCCTEPEDRPVDTPRLATRRAPPVHEHVVLVLRLAGMTQQEATAWVAVDPARRSRLLDDLARRVLGGSLSVGAVQRAVVEEEQGRGAGPVEVRAADGVVPSVEGTTTAVADRPFPQDRTRGSPEMSDRPSRVVVVTEGPGTRLKELLASLGLVPDGCRCRERMQEMNNWGLDGCRRNREQIVTWLREEAGKRGWWAHVVAAWRAAREGLVFTLNPLDPAPGLLDEALRREEARLAAPPEGGGP